MVPRAIQTERARRRGTVMILVVGVLAMLFIVGSTLLIVSRFERQSAKTFSDGRDRDAASVAIIEPIVEGLREDVVGKDGTPYNRGWTPTETSVMEDYADFPGQGNNLVRSGDFLLSSSEPLVTDNKARVLSASSGAVDGLSTITGVTLPGPVTVGFTSSPPTRDADGDGLVDSADVNAGTLVSMFGSNYEVDLRVDSHGGKVLLDPQTPATLLAQVIHQEDWVSGKLPKLFQGTNAVVLSATDEANLRRRYMLPKNLGTKANGDPVEAKDLPATDIRNRLQISLGYYWPSGAASDYRSLTPHWWPAAYDADGGSAWWQARITPPSQGMDETGYVAATDVYDRQHLMTVKSSDDILRPDRDEAALKSINAANGRTFYDIINPTGLASTSFVESGYGYVRDFDKTAATTGIPVGVPAFNVAGLRTAFSLRDVLDQEWDTTSPGFFKEKLPYRRFEQLMAYYLAMIQHTTVPSGDQLLTAAQLAVNTIDFADADSVSTCVEVPGLTKKVYGVEKQPFFTEAYAKVLLKAESKGSGAFAWKDESIYAVELYNPYDQDLSLVGLQIQMDNDPATIINLDAAVTKPVKTIPAHSYLVIANRADDQTIVTGDTNFIPTYESGKNVPGRKDGENFFVVGNGLRITTDSNAGGGRVQLVRAGTHIVELFSDGSFSHPSSGVVIDEMRPVFDRHLVESALDLGKGEWAGPDAGTIADPTTGDAILVRDTSLQRPKEEEGKPPQYWYFTLGRQMLFPLPEYEQDSGNGLALGRDAARKPQHNLLGTHPMMSGAFLTADPKPILVGSLPYGHPTNKYCDNQWIAWREALGVQLGGSAGVFKPLQSPCEDFVEITLGGKLALAPFPIVTSDRGVDPNTGGCLAFPTTGTLLLVTRYAHVSNSDSSDPIPVTAGATRDTNGTFAFEPLTLVDNGHMPVFDANQQAQDWVGTTPQGRFDVPWGQMVYDYFTALPMEELVRPLPQAAIGVAGWPRLIDQTEADYASMYLYNTLFAVYDSGNLSASYPLMAKVDSASSPFGPKVNGRINVNIAPWWVLDGLPVLPDAMPSFSSSFTSNNAIPNKNGGVLSGLPVAELESSRLDPDALDKTERAGVQVVRTMIDEEYRDQNPPYSNSNLVTVTNPKCGMPSVSANLARYMVSYREGKALYDKDGNLLADAGNGGNPGFVSTGAICNVLGRIPVLVRAKTDGGSKKDMYLTLNGLREYKYEATKNDENTTVRPFGYVGYLQAIAPMVRLQDWATVKSHVFTIYAVIRSDKEQPGLRTQVTVDRTRCLYTNDLPERITETAPIGYYNALDD